MRLFVAIHFSRETEQRLLSAIRALRQQGHGTFTRPENLHMTLAFIGETDRLEAAKAAVARVQAPAFSLEVSRIGAFGELYWAGAERCAPLLELQRQVSGNLRAEGFSLESRSFQPHLTLVRRFVPAGSLDLAAVERALGRSVSEIREVSLMESTRREGRLLYLPRYTRRLEKA
ncbi:MAG: RNA 2',3'-cyclic phosphodiesterase [Oscillospiraceae bacterium]